MPPPPIQPAAATADLLAQLDVAWGQGRWADVQLLLNRLEGLAPSTFDFADKRYAAHIAAGQDLLTKGNKTGAAEEFGKAQQIDPDRGEARAALLALTPTPTPTPKPKITPEMQAYTAYMYPRFLRIGSALQTVAAESQQVRTAPAIMFTNTWQVKMGVALGVLTSNGREIQQYEPVPPEFKRVDDLTVAAGKDVVAFANDYAAGLDALNAQRIDRATTHLQSALERADQMNTELRKVAQEYGIDMDTSGDMI